MIRLVNICKKYDDHIVLNNINLKINKGELLAIIGPSGAGKTSLINIIGLLEQADGGQLFFKGHEIKYNSKSSLLFHRKYLSYLCQNYGLIDDMTIYDNIKYSIHHKDFKQISKEKIIETLSNLGINCSLETKVYTLSGGEQQRVALARIILKDSDLIICDEPTGSLDDNNAKIVINTLIALNKQGKTVIIVTHDLKLASVCKRVIKLNEYR